MSLVLVDSSVWIDYFRGSSTIKIKDLENFIDNNQICTNNLILAELLPSLIHQKENELVDILESIHKIHLEINWEELINFQKINLKNGINNVGIPDLIILQNIIQNNLILYSIDKHFKKMAKFHKYAMV
jgi:hypothetical protein